MLNKSAMLRLALAASLMGAANLALAQSANANLGVTASVSQRCTISTTAVAFGAYDPLAVVSRDATGTVVVACSKNSTGLSIGLGLGANALSTQRRLVGTASGDFLSYGLFQPPSNAENTACSFPASIVWDNTDALELTTAPSKAARTYNVCGTIPAGEDVTADSYTDTVVATINF